VKRESTTDALGLHERASATPEHAPANREARVGSAPGWASGELSLRSHQEWFLAVITTPEHEPAPVDSTSAGRLVTPSSTLSSLARLEIYRRSYQARLIECLADDGRIAIIAVLGGATANINLATVLRRRLTITGSTLRPRSVEFKTAIALQLREKVWPLIEAGRVKPMLFRRFPLADAAAAHALMESSQHVGKIVLDVTPQAGEVPNR